MASTLAHNEDKYQQFKYLSCHNGCVSTLSDFYVSFETTWCQME